MSPSSCLEGASAVVPRPGGLRPTALANLTGTASRRLRVLDLSVLSVVEGLVEVAEEAAGEVRDSGTRTGAIVQGATRQVAAHHLGDAEAQATIAGVPAEAHRLEGESVMPVLLEVAPVEEGAARAIQMLATGAPAVIVAVVGTVADVGDSAAMENKRNV